MDDDTRSARAADDDRSDVVELRQRATDLRSDLDWVAGEVVTITRHYRGLVADVADEAARVGIAHPDWRDVVAAWALDDLVGATDALLLIHDTAELALDI